MTILFVCSGNTCRSPLAISAWRALGREDEALSDIEIASAGLAANGGRASSHAQGIARGWNDDLSAHRARILRLSLARQCDLIVTMTGDQAQKVRAQFGLPTHRVRVLGEFDNTDLKARDLESTLCANAEPSDEQRLAALLGEEISLTFNSQRFDIADPYGGSREAYASCASKIKNCVAGLRQALRDETISL